LNCLETEVVGEKEKYSRNTIEIGWGYNGTAMKINNLKEKS
jgi:hypothetical protein